MPSVFLRHTATALMTAGLLAASSTQAVLASDTHGHDHSHDSAHTHDHNQGHADESAHSHNHDEDIHAGYFDDDQVKARALSDWEGDWRSVYPLLQSGTLDEVFAHKAQDGDKSAEAYKQYYREGYRTDVERIDIHGQDVTFHANGDAYTGRYADDGHEILEYKAGNRGVRYSFKKTAGDEQAPEFIQFSDHDIAPTDAHHYHLYMGDDRQALLDNVVNWPTYYPASLSDQQIAQEMMAH
ncbi:zinc transport system substrate-binding protein [Kushneria avicenniae]|uniref:Zinc transport system substrate-binding protein n=1 Tax=Kushneria avicenniae TaxID=402385 RepID=A0A1I1LEK5_9GAMM|nr:metal-binding protein ZinT [Kushneria avicenniae]SFC71396.1 zinc transport system substrate-binding protein [Kushneria avicenniae]